MVCHTCDGEGDVAPTELSARQRKRLAHSGKAPQRQPRTPAPAARVVPGNSSPGGPPKVAIVGGGLAGCATALALKQRGVACMIYEGDTSQNERPAMRLTLQQGRARCGRWASLCAARRRTGTRPSILMETRSAPTRPRKMGTAGHKRAARTSSAPGGGCATPYCIESRRHLWEALRVDLLTASSPSRTGRHQNLLT